VKAPEDYSLRLLVMEKVGEQERSETGRKIGEIVVPEEALEPMVIALQPADEALSSSDKRLSSDLIKIIPTTANRSETEDANESSSSLIIPETESKPIPSVVPVGVNQEILDKSLQDEGIKVIGIVTKDGRLDGEANLIQVHFVSDTMSDDAIYEKFLYICAIIYGHDMGQNLKAEPSVNEVNTVDTIMGFAIVEDFPYMVLEGQMADYVAFANKELLYRDWVSKLLIKKLEP
jgi:hypothetical protein